MLPNFESQDPAALDGATWGVGVFAQYAFSWDFAAGMSFSWANYAGVTQDYTTARNGEELAGDLYFTGNLYHPEVYLEYLILGGYDLAPFLEVAGGYTWTTFESLQLFDPAARRVFNVGLEDFGEGALTMSATLRADWRITDTVRVGAGVRYTWATSGILQNMISVPVTVAYNWW